MKRKLPKFSEGGEVPDFSRLTFKEAFAAARGSGKEPMNKEFTWNGNKYNTDLDSGKAPTKAEAKVESAPKATTQARSASKASAEAPAASKREEAPSAPAAQSRKREMKIPEVKYTDEMNDALMNAYGGAGLAKMIGKELVRAGELNAAAKIREGYSALKDAAKSSSKVRNVTEKREPTFKRGGTVSASKRADGIAQRGKTRGKVV